MVKGFLSRLLGKNKPAEPHDKPAPKGGTADTSPREPAAAPKRTRAGDAPARAEGERREGDGPPKRRRRRGGRGRGQGGERTADAPDPQPAAEPARQEAPAERSEGERPRRSRGGRGRGQRSGAETADATGAPEGAPAPRPRRSSVSPEDVLTGEQPRTEPFGPVQVSVPIARALADMGYVAPTPIQEQVIAPMLTGVDLVGQAQTGTGKTAGFGIPIAEAVDGADGYVQALALVPTRELAQQVTDEITRIVRYRGIDVCAVYGGAPIKRQMDQLSAGAQVVVGTPGRVIDLIDRGFLRLDRVRTVVLDEADQMLDIGFLPDIRRILRSTPRSRQTVLFSATVPTQIRRLIYSYLREPQWFRAGEESKPVEMVRQYYAEVARRDKPEALAEVASHFQEGDQAIVFCRMQVDVDRLVTILRRKGITCAPIHGGLPQGERNTVMADFRAGRTTLLISTSLTARGIDVPAVSHVINYDIPEQVEDYVHRIGRTARMGREGTAITFVSEWDLEFWDAIRAHVGEDNLEELTLALYGG
jgi:ATP-dependent RNA helicase DeaD